MKPRDYGDLRNVVYFGGELPSEGPLSLVARFGAERRDDQSVALHGKALSEVPLSHPIRVHSFSEPFSAARFIEQRLVEVLIIDLRRSNPSTRLDASAWKLLDLLFPEERSLHGLRHARILGIVDEGAGGVSDAFHLGRYNIGGVLTSPGTLEVLAQIDHLLSNLKPGKVALCLAGGGIEGLLYELGVLRALDAFLVNRSVVDFDMFCGISAGSILASFLANGVGPDEISRGLIGRSGRIDPIGRGDIFDVNMSELGERLLGLTRAFLPQVLRSPLKASNSAIPSAAFAGNGLREYMYRQLTKPGMQDRFDMLRRPLYIGATDQDTSKAVVFGAEGKKHVPVHRAVRASSALVPFYAPEEIDGRYYIDGAFARTTNMGFAVRQGATLCIMVDPLVPLTSAVPGFVNRQGGVFVAMQGLKALVNGRFGKGIRVLQEMYPQVDFKLFCPEGDEMHLLSGSPMRYFYRREVERRSYESTLRAIRLQLPDLRRSFAHHGIQFRDPEGDTPSVSPPPIETHALGV